MRISDWSSDVCSSDLLDQGKVGNESAHFRAMLDEADQIGQRRVVLGDHRCAGLATAADHEVDLIALEAVHAAAEGGRRFRRAGRVAGGLELQEGMDVVEDRKSTRLNSSH